MSYTIYDEIAEMDMDKVIMAVMDIGHLKDLMAYVQLLIKEKEAEEREFNKKLKKVFKKEKKNA